MPLVIDSSFGITEAQKVKNLGWLRRHWSEVQSFAILPTGVGFPNECYLAAYLTGDRVYLSTWASLDICKQWLTRPVFKGVPVHTKETI